MLISDELRVVVPSSKLLWRLHSSDSQNYLVLPIYLNDQRDVLVSEVYVRMESSIRDSKSQIVDCSQRGVCVLLQSSQV